MKHLNEKPSEALQPLTSGELLEHLIHVQAERIKEVESERDELKRQLEKQCDDLVQAGRERQAALASIQANVSSLKAQTKLIAHQRDCCEVTLRRLYLAATTVDCCPACVGDAEGFANAQQQAGELLNVIDQLKAKR